MRTSKINIYWILLNVKSSQDSTGYGNEYCQNAHTAQQMECQMRLIHASIRMPTIRNHPSWQTVVTPNRLNHYDDFLKIAPAVVHHSRLLDRLCRKQQSHKRRNTHTHTHFIASTVVVHTVAVLNRRVPSKVKRKTTSTLLPLTDCMIGNHSIFTQSPTIVISFHLNDLPK